MAATFQHTGGDIRAVMTTLDHVARVLVARRLSREDQDALRRRGQRGAGARRAPGTRRPGRGGAAGGGLELAREVGRLGQPLYEAQPPTGYPDRAESWVNTGALLGRMNFALSLSHNRFRGAPVPLDALLGGADRGEPAQVLDRLLAVVLHGAATPQTRTVLAAQLESPEITRTTADDRVAKDTDVAKLAALVLGSPEFQRR